MGIAAAILSIATTVIGTVQNMKAAKEEAANQQAYYNYQQQVSENQAQAARNQQQYQVQLAQNQQKFAEYQGEVAAQNQAIAQRAADDARKRGETDASIQRQETRRLIARQRSALAGGGVDVAGQSAVELYSDTAGIGELDALTIRSNAEREALGFETDAYNAGTDIYGSKIRGYESKLDEGFANAIGERNVYSAKLDSSFANYSARRADKQGSINSGRALVSGIASVADKWYGYKKQRGFN